MESEKCVPKHHLNRSKWACANSKTLLTAKSSHPTYMS